MSGREPFSRSPSASHAVQAGLEEASHPEEQGAHGDHRQRAQSRIVLPSIRHGFDFSLSQHPVRTTSILLEPISQAAEHERTPKQSEPPRHEGFYESPQPIRPDHTTDYGHRGPHVDDASITERGRPDQGQRTLTQPHRHSHSYPSTPQLQGYAVERQHRERTAGHLSRSQADSHTRRSAFSPAISPYSPSESYSYQPYPTYQQVRSRSGPPSLVTSPYLSPYRSSGSNEVIRPAAVYSFPPRVYYGPSYTYPEPTSVQDTRPLSSLQAPYARSQLPPIAAPSALTEAYSTGPKASQQQPCLRQRRLQQQQQQQQQRRRRDRQDEKEDDNDEDEVYSPESPHSLAAFPQRKRSASSARGGTVVGPSTAMLNRRRPIDRRNSTNPMQQETTLQDARLQPRGKRHQMSAETRAMMAALSRAEQDMQREREQGIQPPRSGETSHSSTNGAYSGVPGPAAAGTRPRWTLRERSKLFYAVVAEKQLEDMSTFNWTKIARVVNRQEKACKDQWRRETLPFCCRQFQLELPLEGHAGRAISDIDKSHSGNGHQTKAGAQEGEEEYKEDRQDIQGEEETLSLGGQRSVSHDSDATYDDQLEEEDEDDAF
ncbi:hypothetical protein BCR43DRAFT_551275 [Syncephalastrum racemosum]|uniref:Myb-like domain-containing protein n=1 Tax=Syncephalastrum racemosum TaxID=13706 RepID=A0A1X2H916_SYNRA|nr:hypothetical protein BCR43DRAFT_551275 [Syncephalastrum racemosum]